MSGTTTSNNALLAAIIATIKNIQTQAIPLPNTTAAQTYQIANLAPLESSGNLLTPGLKELFGFATDNMQADIATINLAITNGQIPDPATIIDLSTPLHDLWASYQILNYLLYLSAYLGYPMPATQFFAPIIPQVSARINPAPIIVPSPVPPLAPPKPPGTTPTVPTTPTPTTTIPSVPTPTTPTTPTPTTPTSTKLAVGKINLYSGSGQPNNGVAMVAALGINTVYVPVYASVPTQTSTTIDWLNANNNPTIIGGFIDVVVLAYRQAGLKVMLGLEVDCADGTPRSQFFPTNAITFLTNLRALATTFTNNAVRLHCSTISIAPQLFPYQNGGDHPADYQIYWDNIYTACKALYAPPILYVASAANVGPVSANMAMDWSNSWDAIGVKIAPPLGSNSTAATIANYWQTANDTEAAGYAAPIFGTSGWLMTLYNAWKSTGRQLYIETGYSAT